MPDVFYLVDERSDGASKAGQVSQPVQACKPGLGDLSKPIAPAYFWGVKLMFVGVVNFGHVPTLRFVGVNIFWSKSNQNLIILIWSCEQASLHRTLNSNFRQQIAIYVFYKPSVFDEKIFKSKI